MERKPRLKKEYKLCWPYGSRMHIWSIVGGPGGIHLHITENRIVDDESLRYHGGLEVHYRQPPDYMRGDAPSHYDCQIIGGPCWHDGSSLYAQDYWIPIWNGGKMDNERMLELLEGEYMKQFQSAAV